VKSLSEYQCRRRDERMKDGVKGARGFGDNVVSESFN
jgi:hypothetical protein